MFRLGFKPALLGAAAALSLSFGSPPAMAADHRDAPTIDDYSAIDINDLYVFRDPNDPTKLVVALSTQAVADPLFGPSYHFQENALYQLNFTTRADAKPTGQIEFVFGPFGNGPACPAPAPECQVYRASFPDGTVINDGQAVQGTNSATHNDPTPFKTVNGVTVFAGPREDPFFFDLVGFNRSVAAGKPLFTGVDAFKGKNVNAIVIEFPISMVFPAGTCIATPPFSTPCGAWAVTYLGKVDDGNPTQFEKLKQVDRMGNPAVNTALIPAALKDSFNLADPKRDPKDFAGVILDQIAKLDQKFCQNSGIGCTTPNPNAPLLASVAVPDVLRFASNVADGFPNGRRPQDPTLDILIGLILEVPGFTDGTSPKTYCTNTFPFLGPPLQPGGAAQSCP